MIVSHDLIPLVPATLGDTDLPLPGKRSSKVRDWYPLADQKRLLATTDRLSAFDIVLSRVPYQGQVLLLLTNWWMHRTDDLLANHLIAEPDPNATFVPARPRAMPSPRMPSWIAPAVVLKPVNDALLAAKILGLADPSLRKAVVLYQRKQADKITNDDAALHKQG